MEDRGAKSKVQVGGVFETSTDLYYSKVHITNLSFLYLLKNQYDIPLPLISLTPPSPPFKFLRANISMILNRGWSSRKRYIV